MVDRGSCAFTVKVKNAQLAGARAVIVADNAPGTPPPNLAGSTTRSASRRCACRATTASPSRPRSTAHRRRSAGGGAVREPTQARGRRLPAAGIHVYAQP
ncbi:MAG: PA domain-containing protein [Burkholderiaceae bacterium]